MSWLGKRRRVFVFVHIPRTGGSSFISMLSEHFEPIESLKVKSWDPDETDINGRHKFVHGHMNLLPPSGNDEAVYLSIIREPVQRIVSDRV